MRPIVLIFCLLAGCAQVTAVPITDRNPHPRGIPIYGFKPILIVSGQTAKVEAIPNLNERYALQMHAFLAKNHAKVSLRENGTLSSVDANMDSTALTTFLEKALDKFPAGDVKSAGLAAQGEVAVYEFVFHPDGTLSLRKLGHSHMRYTPPEPSATHVVAPPTDDGGGSVQPVDG